ncbi:hypothetical protein [Muricoccus vinaceus]|uniref:Uncharacterized protein n=1 Tax=Muricoccus vinaceus TaxID=424704 RepID=A0ABV6IZS5_9PROT
MPSLSLMLAAAAAVGLLIVAPQIPDEIKAKIRGFAALVAVGGLVLVIASHIETETKFAFALLLAVGAAAWHAYDDQTEGAAFLIAGAVLAAGTFVAGALAG